MSPHYISLLSGYSLTVGLWFLLNHFYPFIWKNKERISFDKPYLEFIYSIIALTTILGIGQLYIRGWLIPHKDNVLLDAVNQFIIFSPSCILILIRKHSIDTIWLPKSKIVIRLFIGLLFALCSIIIYWLTRKDSKELGFILLNIYHYHNLSHLVQVFMEDITIALIFVRLSAWIGNKWTILIAAILFSAGHIPSMISDGAELIELSSLLIDTLVGVLVLLAVSRSKDILWFFMVHFAMDMTQFYGS